MYPVDLRSRSRVSAEASVETIGGCPAVVLQIGGEEPNRSITLGVGKKLQAAVDLAMEKRLPIVGFVSSTGADIAEGVTATHGWGTAARSLVSCSGVVPVIMCVDGPAVSGPALLLGLADFAVMIQHSYAFVSGPGMVELFTGVEVEVDRLGGSDVHAASSGVASILVQDRDSAEAAIEELLNLLPSHVGELPRRTFEGSEEDRDTPNIAEHVPDSPTGSYDVRAILEEVADSQTLLEIRGGWAPNLVTALARIDGWTVGMVANQPQFMAGTLDISASQKGARFVSFCDAFNLPILTFVDTPGFQPGKDLEWRGMIRHGASLAFAYARATVPRVCVTLRKSYGGAYIVMDSKPMGNDLAYAWPTAEIAVMGAKGAVEILHRGAEDADRQRLEDEYAEQLLNPYKAVERGSIDAVIDPTQTRRVIVEALEVLSTKREDVPKSRHENIPL